MPTFRDITMPELNPSKSFLNVLVIVLLGALFATGATISDSLKQKSDSLKQKEAIGSVLPTSSEVSISDNTNQ